MKTRRFRRFHSPSDGDCFFHSLQTCLALCGHEHAALTSSQLRAKVAKHMRDTARTDAQRRAAARAKLPGTWAEHEEVAAAASAFGLRIRVWEGHNRMWVTFGDDAAPLVHMMNRYNSHFEAIAPMKSVQRTGPQARELAAARS